MMTEISWKFSVIKGETERKEKQRIPMKPQASFFFTSAGTEKSMKGTK